MQSNPQVPWTEEQWARVNQAIQEEAQRARVAAKFLPLYGPLPPDTDFVRSVDIPDEAPLKINDKKIIQLSTLQLKVELRGAQLADPEMGSVLSLFRRAANILARLEDALVFKGQPDADQLPPDTNNLKAQISGGQHSHGLIDVGYVLTSTLVSNGATLVKAVTDAISHLETHGHFGPFAVVLPPDFFGLAQQPTHGRPQVTPKDRDCSALGRRPAASLLALSPMAKALSWRSAVSRLNSSSPPTCRCNSCRSPKRRTTSFVFTRSSRYALKSTGGGRKAARTKRRRLSRQRQRRDNMKRAKRARGGRRLRAQRQVALDRLREGAACRTR